MQILENTGCLKYRFISIQFFFFFDGKKARREGVPAGHQPHGTLHAQAFRTTPRVIVAGERGLTPARALLNHRQARFIQRLYARPRDGGGVTEATKQLQEAPVVAMATAMAATTTRTMAMAIRCCGNGDATAMAMLWQ